MQICGMFGLGLLLLSMPAFSNVGIGTSNPTAGLDVATTGSASAVILPRDTTTNRPGVGVNGMIRYNTTANVMEGFFNGTWAQVLTQPVGSTTGVTTSGPPVSAAVYAYSSVTANYSPGFGTLANAYDQIWIANGSGDFRNTACTQINDATSIITFDFGSVKTIRSVYYSVGASAGLALTFSLDNVTYSTSALAPYPGGGAIQYGTVALSPVPSARYVRVTVSGPFDANANDLCEIAFGP